MIDYDKPDDDPIAAEVRPTREQLAARFDHDLAAIMEDARRQTEDAARAGHTVISLPPRRPQGWTEPSKKVG